MLSKERNIIQDNKWIMLGKNSNLKMNLKRNYGDKTNITKPDLFKYYPQRMTGWESK